MEFLVASGGGSLDELIVRVPNDPKEIAESLTQLADKHYIKAAGPKSIRDFHALVAQVAENNGNKNDNLKRRGRVLEEIIQHQRDFMATIVRPTTLGLTFGLR